MKYLFIILIAICAIILFDIMASSSSLCDARGKVINVVSGDVFEVEFDENSDSPINQKVNYVKLDDITVCDPSSAIETAKASLLNRYVCLDNLMWDAYGNITCSIYQMVDNSPIKKSFNSILVDIGYAELKKANDTPKSQSNIYEPDYDPIRVIENPPQFPGRSNSSPTAKDSI